MSDATFPRTVRVTRKKEIDAIFRGGRTLRRGPLRAVVHRNGTGATRLAISVPKRAGNAVARNRWKRLIREAFRLHRAGLPGGWDVMVIPQGAPGDSSRQDVEGWLIPLIQSLR